MNAFFAWLRKTVDTLCDRPDHLQRLSIIGSGVVIYALVLMLVGIVWKGFGAHLELMPQQIGILGIIAYSAMGLLGLVIITLLGTIKGIHIKGPGGVDVDLQTTAEAKDNDPPTQTTTTTTTTTQGDSA